MLFRSKLAKLSAKFSHYVLGGAGTAIASYLARARGHNEPQASERLVEDLRKFIRDIKAFIEDHGEKDANGGEGDADEAAREFEFCPDRDWNVVPCRVD